MPIVPDPWWATAPWKWIICIYNTIYYLAPLAILILSIVIFVYVRRIYGLMYNERNKKEQ